MHSFFRSAFFLLPFPIVCTTANAQNLTFGAITGTNLTDDVRSGRAEFPGGTLPSGETTSSTYIVDPGGRRFIIGLKMEYRLPRHWAIEFNALHREWKSTSANIISPPIELPDGTKFSVFGPFTRTLTTWEFPILAKYRLPLRTLHPFVEAGPSFRPAGTGSGLSHAGISAGGGVELQAGGFRFAPTLRYTRWSTANAGFFGAVPNQVEFLVGIDRPSTELGFRAFGQRLSIGGIVGIGLGRDFKPPVSDFAPVPESNSGIYGLMIEASLTKSLAVEVDGLYRPLHGSDDEFGRSVRFAHLTWEFPVLLKYRFLNHARVRPIVEAGPSFRAEGNLNLQRVSHYGVTMGAGIETKISRLKISPIVRYTHWGDSKGSPFQPQAWTNQTQVLLSFAF